MTLSRRAFLGVARSGRGDAMRPPWALPEALFLDACTRCGECITACPSGLLVKGDGGFPEADFSVGRAPDGCTFCGDCRQSCTPLALREQPRQSPWSLRAFFSPDCLTDHNVVCRTCGELCDAGAIHFPPMVGGVARPQLDSAACTGCGACLADCPTRAICIAPPNFPSLALRGAT